MTKFLIPLTAAAAAIALTPALAQTAQQAPAPAGKRALPAETRADAQARAQRLFARFDTNRDGFVTQAEASAVEAQRAARRTERAAKQAARAQRRDPAKVFARLDANNDGQITRAEAEAARTARAVGKPGQPANAHAVAYGNLFQRADANRDGAITRAEFAAAAPRHDRASMAGRRSHASARMLTAGDIDKDGRVSLAEVQQLTLRRFERLDLNRDGTITPEERRQAREQRKAQRRPG